MNDSIQQMAKAAGAAANAGRWQEAETLWREVRKLDQNNVPALLSLAVHALMRKEFAEARVLLETARAAAPRDVLVLLTLARACREAGDDGGERDAIEATLAVDPYCLAALLAKAARLERLGATANAAMYFRNAVKIAPPEAQWPENLRSQLTYARQASARHAIAFDDYLAETIRDLQSSLPPDAQERWREAAAIMSGRSKPYFSDSNQLFVPRLPAIPFFDRAQFPWVRALEAKTDVIRAELMAALEAEREDFAPYIAYRPGEPVNQWQELNHSKRWSAYQLWRNGTPVESHLQQCPKTAEALAAVEMAVIGGLCPNAMFSALAPHTQIPPHNGETNARLVVHLPLIVPDKCWYRVGYEERQWKVGEVLIFDDTIEHEARNDSDELRVVLIFDVWNPLLSPAERRVVTTMLQAGRDYGA